jgi:hypothetical protein
MPDIPVLNIVTTPESDEVTLTFTFKLTWDVNNPETRERALRTFNTLTENLPDDEKTRLKTEMDQAFAQFLASRTEERHESRSAPGFPAIEASAHIRRAYS